MWIQIFFVAKLFCCHLRCFVAKSFFVAIYVLFAWKNWTKNCACGEKGQISGMVAIRLETEEKFKRATLRSWKSSFCKSHVARLLWQEKREGRLDVEITQVPTVKLCNWWWSLHWHVTYGDGKFADPDFLVPDIMDFIKLFPKQLLAVPLLHDSYCSCFCFVTEKNRRTHYSRG